MVCLCRAASDDAAVQRVKKSLSRQYITISGSDMRRLSVYAASFAEQQLGLDENVYLGLCESVTHLIHAAWPVHFGASLDAFIPHLSGALDRCIVICVDNLSP